MVNGEEAFTYDYHGSREAFVIVGDRWYKVSNSSLPSLDEPVIFPDVVTKLKVTYKPTLGFGTEEYIIELDADENCDSQLQAIVDWFYDLGLEVCEEPEHRDGVNESYDFIINGKEVFTYNCYGENSGHVRIGDRWYKVNNNSRPPLDGFTEK